MPGKRLDIPTFVGLLDIVQQQLREFRALAITIEQAGECLILDVGTVEDQLGKRLEDVCACVQDPDRLESMCSGIT